MFKAEKSISVQLPNDSGSTLIVVIIIAVISGVILQILFFSSRNTLKSSGRHLSKVTSLNIAEAGKERILGELRSRKIKPIPGQTSTVYTNSPFGSGSYTVRYSTNVRNDTICIVSMGRTDKDTVEIEIIALLTPFTWRNWVKGAVTARTTVISSGGIVIDGRDHDTTGTLLATGGTFGVSSGDSVDTDGKAKIGGGSTAPQQVTIEDVTVDSHIDTTGYPRTPEEVLGLPPGSLDGFKKTCSATPFRGITYLESNCNNYTGSGILICHNSTGTASLENYNGDFKGLIIADADKHVNNNANALGAVVMLGTFVGGNVFGNGNANIFYSSLMVEQAIKDAYDLADQRWDVPVLSWRQVK